MKDEPHYRPPKRIDIYVDGSWLSKGKNNPKESGGWGAIIIETYDNNQETWTASGPTGQAVHSGPEAEIYAALSGLHAVLKRAHKLHWQAHKDGSQTTIILHTDQKFWQDYIENIKRQGITVNNNSNPTKQLLGQLAQLVNGMDIKVQYTSHNKTAKAVRKRSYASDDANMDIPHDLASREAWAARVERQDGFIHLCNQTYKLKEGQEPHDLIDSLLKPVNRSGRHR